MAELHRHIDHPMDKAIKLLSRIYKDFTTRIQLVFDKRMEGEETDNRFLCYLAWEYQDKLGLMKSKFKEQFDCLIDETNALKDGMNDLKVEEIDLWMANVDEF